MMERKLLALILTAGLAIACKGNPTDTPKTTPATPEAAESSPNASRALRIAYFEPKSYDPAHLHGGPGKEVAENLFEGLCSHASDGKIIPGQAKSWTASKDGLVWTFELRDGLVWSDGTPITAHDFVWSLRRSIDPKNGNPKASELLAIKNARAITKKEIKTIESLGVTAKDNKTVVVTLESPYPYVTNLMASGYTLPVPKHVVEKYGKEWTNPKHLVTNGAYIVHSHTHDQEMQLVANSKYWDAKSVSIQTVKYRYTKEARLAYQWYSLNEIDWCMGLIPQEEIKRLQKQRDPALHIHPYDGLFYLVLDTQKPPFNETLVRRAFDLAIDRARLTRQVTGLGERPAKTFIPPGMTSSRPPRRVRYDPEEARKLLAQSKFAATQPMPSIELMLSSSDLQQKIAEFLQRNLKENLGVTLVLQNIDWKTFLDRLNKNEFQMCQLSMGGGFNPAQYLDVLETGSQSNYAKWSNSEFDAVAKEARKATTKSNVEAAITKALAIADKEVPMPALYRLTKRALIRPGLKGFNANAEDRHLLKWLSWGKSE